jgi:peptidoglycan/LPS O-acetylase OafA/YrhL
MRTRPSPGFRADIEGLRAVAVLAVVLAHAGVPGLTGGFVGVDVFFVISGFLITGLLVNEVERTGRVSLVAFYGRRAKRLLPLAAIVLAFVVVVAAILFNPVRRDAVSGDVVASALSVVNWRFAAQAVDYFAATGAASPVRHFWSLAVEEQFYFVWPSVLLAVTWWHRRRGRSVRGVALATIAVIGVASFAYGLRYTESTPDAAYFSTLTRGWELALGAALAVALRPGGWRPGRWTGRSLGAAGLAAIAVAIVVFADTTPFPGTAALLPTLGAAAVILGGSGAQLGLLGIAPARYLGRISYSWYLWHWPLLVFAAAAWGTLSLFEGLAVAAASLVPTVISHHLVEQRLHYSPSLSAQPRRALRLGALCVAAAVVAGVLLSATAPSVRTASADEVAGAAVVAPTGFELQRTASRMRPNPRDADADQPPMYQDGCLVGRTGTSSPSCVYGDRSSKTTVVLYGDSHAIQYAPALEPIARKRHWRLVVLSKQGCSPASVPIWNGGLGRRYRECETWRERTFKRVERERPTLIFTDSANTYAAMPGGVKLRGDSPESADALVAGYTRTLRRLKAIGVPVALMANGPFSTQDVPSCVSGALDHLERCATPKATALRYAPVNRRAAEQVPGVTLIDPTPMICPDEVCPAVIGDVLVYRDTNHLTATYARTLAPWLESQLPAPARSR